MRWILMLMAAAFTAIAADAGWRMALSYLTLWIGALVSATCFRIAYDLWNAEYGRRPIAVWIADLEADPRCLRRRYR